MVDVRILRIEPSIRGVQIRIGEPVRLDVAVYGRQDIRDDSLGDRPEISFDWTSEAYSAEETPGTGEFRETVAIGDGRERNGEPDDRRASYIAPNEPGRYLVQTVLEIGVECLGRRDGESDDDAIERCSAEFEVVVRRPSAHEPTPVPPRDPSGEIPSVIVDDGGTNYQVFTPDRGGEFVAEGCSLKIPEGAVNDMEVIGVSVEELESPDEQLEVLDPRFMTAGLQCRISAVASDGTPLTDYRLLQPGEICMPLPDVFRPKAVNALVGAINPDATLTALGSRLFLTTSAGDLKVCGKISSLSATTAVALRAEVAKDIPPTPVAEPVAGEIETGARRLSEAQVVALMLVSIAMIVAAAATLRVGRRRYRSR